MAHEHDVLEASAQRISSMCKRWIVAILHWVMLHLLISPVKSFHFSSRKVPIFMQKM